MIIVDNVKPSTCLESITVSDIKPGDTFGLEGYPTEVYLMTNCSTYVALSTGKQEPLVDRDKKVVCSRIIGEFHKNKIENFK